MRKCICTAVRPPTCLKKKLGGLASGEIFLPYRGLPAPDQAAVI